MEKFSSFDDDDGNGEQRQQHGWFACWGRLRSAFPWRRLRKEGSERQPARRGGKMAVRRRGSFKYDPLSYAQNFDEGAGDEDEEGGGSSRGFSSRFVAPRPLVIGQGTSAGV